jgi:hypothetical protein
LFGGIVNRALSWGYTILPLPQRIDLVRTGSRPGTHFSGCSPNVGCRYTILLGVWDGVIGGQIPGKPVAEGIVAETGNAVVRIDFATDLG